jgi:hypothetical protein
VERGNVVRVAVVGPKAVVLVVVALFACANIAACTLESRGLAEGAPQAPGSAADASASDASSSGAVADAAGSVDSEDAPSDAAPSSSDAAVGNEGGDSCDRDGDGHRDAAGLCVGDDCCDTDARAHPGVKDFFDTPNACGSFDYNCDSNETVETGPVHCQLGFFACSGDGFAASASCGASATFSVCSWAGLACSTKDEARVQRCH